MNRIFLFLLTNMAVLVVGFFVLSLLGVEGILQSNGVDLDLGSLLVFSAVFGMSGAFVSLLLSKWMATRAVGAQVITEPRAQHEHWLLQAVSHHAQAAGIGMPEVAVYEDDTPNAFATGARRDHALVAVSTGLLRGMEPKEVDAVLAHEVSHIANGDMITMTLLQGVVNTFVIFFSRVAGFLIDRLVFKNERGLGMGYFISSIVMQILFGILASFIVMWFSRQREFRADAGAARLAGREKMIAALTRLSQQPGAPLPGSLLAFGINSGEVQGWRRLMLSHPPMEERIDALRRGHFGAA